MFIMEVMLRYVENTEVIYVTQHSFIKGKLRANFVWQIWWSVLGLVCCLMVQCPSGEQWLVTVLRGQYWDWCHLTCLWRTWTVGLVLPQTSLLIASGCEVLSTFWREGMPSRGTLSRLRSGPVITPWSSTRQSVQFFCVSPNQKYKLAEEWVEIRTEEKYIGVLVVEKLKTTCQHVLGSLETQLYSRLHQKKCD